MIGGDVSPSADWYALQLYIAERVAALTGLSFEEALLRFTNCYRRCGLGRSREPEDPVWQAFLRGLQATDDRAGWAAEFCRARVPRGEIAYVGCFHYDYYQDTRKIRVHFANNDTSGAGPLSRERRPVRREELRGLFTAIAAAHPDARTVGGVSWLHGITAYRSLYPPEYGQSARPLPMERALPSMPLWGQFLDHAGCVKEDLAGAFRACIERADSIARLAGCFPQQVYQVECDIQHFYRYYGIGRPRGRAP